MAANRDYVNALCRMGFTEQQAKTAVLATNNESADAAVDWIFQHADENTNDFPMDNEMQVEDEDLMLALKLQQEEENRQEQTIKCQLTNKPVPISKLYIADECSHKFDREALIKYIGDAVITQVTVKCPVPGCGAPLSLRDMKELMPEMPKPKPHRGGIIPTTASKQATQRISNELQHILKSKPEKQGFSVQPVRDNLYLWELRFFSFDPKDLIAQDLAKMKKDYILLHIAFPPTYPLNPPFVRVIRPRFAFRTGHVTVGGSICTELLTNKGWTAANTIEAVIVSIRAQFMEGGARLDFSNTRDYTEAEAKEAFDRMVQTHGWH